MTGRSTRLYESARTPGPPAKSPEGSIPWDVRLLQDEPDGLSVELEAEGAELTSPTTRGGLS